MALSAPKADGAFRTIGELSDETGIAQHILRYWETKFPQLRPLTRAGNRRYYRPDDVTLVRRIDALLHREGYTMKGAQQALAATSSRQAPVTDALPTIAAIRDSLVKALLDDEAAARG
ncbi:DNA-binding transcriptional MerR regulator [Sphingomonas jinjuensis]|uniref:DNA-binding transcriptional MerR regulator n=1 Tax=Sphingomonas jinjuensis TaxID=535907 RepID=A0A840F758_9SPHN|nr:MerR family transcriptional regulator [Sphingomonas jinjuensis]MBB4152156.1 DNA-binding transcriptional MerR regulator [Sphingomonas jinjuensis]